MQRLMQRRAPKGWLLAAALVVLCLSAIGGPRAVPAANGDEPQGQTGAFRHGSHLSPTWHTTERSQQFEQHCRVCHDYDASAPLGLGAPTAKCASCHFSDPTQPQGDASRLVVRGGEPTGAARTFSFAHDLKGHRERACAECHTWSPGPRGDYRHADVVFAMPATMAVCAQCHHHGAEDPGAGSQRVVHTDGGGAAWRATWDRANGCESCHQAGTPRLLDGHRRTQARSFDHASHVPTDDLGPGSKGRSCNGCHAIDGAAAATSGMGVQQRSCGECHFGDQGAPTTRLVDDVRVERMPTQFTHATEGHQKECSTCHPMAAGARDPEVGRMYADCTKTCHSERRVERHGAWSCSDCHRSSDPRAERDPAAVQAIAKVAVQRPADGSRFAFAAMRHPGITAGADTIHAAAGERACADCHRREVPGLVAAATPRAFTHEGHLASLGKDVPDTACTVCHTTVRATTSARSVQPFQADSVREVESCTAKCHQSPQLAVTASATTVEVPVFNHAQHARHACAECHVGDRGVTDLRDAPLSGGTAFSCARCHGHKQPEKIAVTGGYDTTKENDTCRECHAPKQKPSYVKEQRAQQRFQLAGDVRQFHQKGGDCAKCHGLERGRGAPSRAPVQVLSRYDLHQSHGKVRRADGSIGDIAAVRGTDACLSCHAWDPRRR